jgi:hypothetical protein
MKAGYYWSGEDGSGLALGLICMWRNKHCREKQQLLCGRWDRTMVV